VRIYVVLGHADECGKIDNDCLRRLAYADGLGHDPEDKLVLSGGSKSEYPDSEAAQMLSYISAWKADQIILENNSHTTAENAHYVCKWLQDNDLAEAEVFIITSNALSWRGRYFFRWMKRYHGLPDLQVKGLPSHRASLSEWIYEIRCIPYLRENIDRALARDTSK
jgi:hypothetical protein